MKIWLDDVRRSPEGEADWVECTTAEQAIALIGTCRIKYISFDHDLGEGRTGYDVAKFIEEGAYAGRISPIDYAIHSANPVGAMNIKRAMDSAFIFWGA